MAQFAPNAFGLHDMHGNVLELCLDALAPYTAAPVQDPFVAIGPARVLRGGDWRARDVDCRSGVRSSRAPHVSTDRYGFRVVLGPVLTP